ncbi:MAG: efflux RND transporter periplasmic adaptor subunit [Pseudomonadota bacterium]
MKSLPASLAVACLSLGLVLGPEGTHAQAAEAKTSPTKQLDKKKSKKPAKLGGRASIVGVDPVRLEPLSQTVPIIGRFVAVRSGRVSAEVGGAVRELKVAIGDHVKTGDLIARLDNVAMRAQLAVEESQIQEGMAELGALEAEQLLAEQDLKRQNDLKKSGAFSRAKYEDAIQNVAKAKANIVKARAAIETRKATKRLTEINLAKAEIHAPYAGVVSEKLTELGSYVRPGDSVVSLVSDTSLEIEAAVPSVRVVGLVPGGTVRWALGDGRVFQAKVRALLPTENPLTRTRPVRFTPVFNEPIGGLADSQTVTVHVPLRAGKTVLTVHKDAIIKRGGKSLVYVVADDKAEARSIALGDSTGARIEVTSGLAEGDLAIVRGNERLRPGADVKVREGS